MTHDWPSVSVVVPTYNRSAQLADTLASLVEQDYPAGRLEIIVVDNASTDRTPEVARQIQARSRFPVRYVREMKRGAPVARNRGLAEAQGEIVAFIDSDCQAPNTWVRRAMEKMRPEVGVLSGPVCPVVNPQRPPRFFCHQTNHQKANLLFPTANVFYRRKVIQDLGGFDEQYGALPWGIAVFGDDTDLAWRVKRAGHASLFAPDAPVFHEASSIRAKAWLLEPVRMQALASLVARFPELRDELWWRRCVDERDPAFYLALLSGLAFAITRRPLSLALTLPWLWLMRGWVENDVWPPRRWWHIPFKYALLTERFALQTCALLWGSVRYRSLVL